MNKSELVSRLTERLGGDRATATAAVNGVLEEIEGSVARGERVSLMGFGTFERRERASRTGRNPRTGAAIQVAASAAPVFRASAGFRTLVTHNGGSAAIAAEDPAPAAAKKKAGKKAAKKAAAATPPKAAKTAKADAAGTSKKATKKAAGKGGKKADKKGR